MNRTEERAAKAQPFSTLFLRNRHLLTLTIVILLVAGASALATLPRIEDPRITNRNPVIVTLLPGASAKRVESRVTEKLEERLREVSEIKEIESVSRAGVSLISLELEDRIGRGANEMVFSKIRDKLADAGRELPPDAGKPDFDDKRGAVAFGLIAAVRWNGPEEMPRLGVMNRLAGELADRLRILPGTESVRLYGEPIEEITVTADPHELNSLGLTTADVARRIRGADAKGQAGALRTSRRDVLMEVAGELDNVQRIAAIPLVDNGAGGVVHLDDVASVTKEWLDPPREIALSDGQRAIFVAARVEAHVRMDRWANEARRVVRTFAVESGGERVHVDVVFDQNRYTGERLAGLGGNLLAGAGVVMLVVWLAMGWRAALIVGSALPLSAGATLFGLTFFGQQIHQMTIFGMIIAIGLLIDNAIVVTDEVARQKRTGVSHEAAMGRAVRHLFAPLLASTLTTILGFMPIFLLSGNVGNFVSPIAISVVLALIASFTISMTVVAALAARFGSASAPGIKWWHDGIDVPQLQATYRRFLTAVVRRPMAAVALACILPAAGFALATTLGNQFFPPADRDQFEVEVWLSSDASIAYTTGIAGRIEKLIRTEAGVERVDWLVGGSFPSVYYNLIMDKDDDPSYAHAIVKTDGLERANAMIPRLREVLDRQFPEARIVVSPFGQGPPIDAPISFRILGPDPDRLRQFGEQLRRVMHQVPGVLHTQATVMGGEPKLWFQADEYEAQLAGLSLRDIAGQLQGNLEGQVGGSVLEDLEELPVRIRYGNEERGSLQRISSMNLVSTRTRGDSAWIPVTTLGEVTLKPELAGITHRNGERVNHVRGYLTRSVLPIDASRAVLERLDRSEFALPPGYRLEVGGDSEEQRRAVGSLMTYLPVLAVLMVASLVLSFRSGVLAAMVGAVAVLSVGLGMLSLWLAGFPIGFNPIIGSAGLVGVAINGSIVVLAAIRANPSARAAEPEALVEQIMVSSRHILSTTLTTMGGFLPLLLFTGGAFWPPLAVVIAGGVGFTVTLSLVLTPALYRLVYQYRVRRAYRTIQPTTVKGVLS